VRRRDPAVNKLGTMGLILSGFDDLKKQVLPAIASGEAMASYRAEWAPRSQ
jgi:hypothetical protein